MAKATGGGAATHSGTDYQNRCAAWFSTLILAEQDAALPLELPARDTLEFIACETQQPVDDLNLTTSSGGVILGQAKHTLSLETTPDSDLAGTLDQFVRQFMLARSRVVEAVPPRPNFDPAYDRLVLLTSPGSSRPIKIDLPALLMRVRSLAPHKRGQGLDAAATNDGERQALKVIRAHIEQSWSRNNGSSPTEADLGSFLEVIHILILDVDPEGTHEREAKSLLRQSVLKSPSNADVVWKSWIENQALLARTKAGLDRAGIQASLIRDGIDLRAARSYREDIETLIAYTRDTLKHQARFATIRLGNCDVKIDRPCTSALVSAASGGSLLIVGEPGAGKSGTQFEAVLKLREKGFDVLMMAAEGLSAESLGTLRSELRLTREFIEVLENWPGASPGYLVIDALDAARSEGVARTLRSVIERVVRGGTRWRVIASIRKFDLRYSAELKQLVPGEPPSEFRDQEFARVRHLNVPLLDESEFTQAKTQSDALRGVIDLAGPHLLELLRVPFNLSLVAALIESGVTASELTPIRTQLELLDRYWAARVILEDKRGDAREAVLRVAAEEMVRRRGLRAPRNIVSRDPAASEHLHVILSASVLVEWQPPGAIQPDASLLAFSHHLLFDYATARLIFRGEPSDFVRRLEEEPDLSMAVRPSIVLHFHHLWAIDPTRKTFWDLVERVQQSQRMPDIAKTVGPTVAGELFETTSDLAPVIARLGGKNE